MSISKSSSKLLFRALIVQRHNRVLSDDEFLHLLKAHVDQGGSLIKNDTSGFKSEDDYVDYLVELTRKGLEQRTEESVPMIETTPAFGGLINLKIGWENDAAVSVEFNIGKSYGENKKDKISHLRVRQFWREKGL